MRSALRLARRRPGLLLMPLLTLALLAACTGGDAAPEQVHQEQARPTAGKAKGGAHGGSLSGN